MPVWLECFAEKPVSLCNIYCESQPTQRPGGFCGEDQIETGKRTPRAPPGSTRPVSLCTSELHTYTYIHTYTHPHTPASSSVTRWFSWPCLPGADSSSATRIGSRCALSVGGPHRCCVASRPAVIRGLGAWITLIPASRSGTDKKDIEIPSCSRRVANPITESHTYIACPCLPVSSISSQPPVPPLSRGAGVPSLLLTTDPRRWMGESENNTGTRQGMGKNTPRNKWLEQNGWSQFERALQFGFSVGLRGPTNYNPYPKDSPSPSYEGEIVLCSERLILTGRANTFIQAKRRKEKKKRTRQTRGRRISHHAQD